MKFQLNGVIYVAETTSKNKSSRNVDSDFTRSGKKDPRMAALFAIIAIFITGLPALVYLYVGNSRKAFIYCVGPTILSVVMVIGATVIGLMTFGLGLVLLVPVILIILALNIAIVVDIYELAKGEKGILPNF